MNKSLIHELVKKFKDARYKECNYYMADSLLAATAIEWAVERLEGRLAKCLNADKGYCDIWYLDSHSECKMLMELLYEFTEDDKYLTQHIIHYADPTF